MLLQCLGALAHHEVIQSGSEICIFLHLHHVFLIYIFPSLECHWVGWVQCRGLLWVSKLKSVHGCSKISSVFWIGDADIGADLTCSPDIPLRASLPCPVVYVTLEAWFSSFELGLPSSLVFDATISLSSLITSMTSLLLPPTGLLHMWAYIIPFIVIGHDDTRIFGTFKIMLRTIGHESREPMNTLAITFLNSLILKV